jgi:hypothetical protein
LLTASPDNGDHTTQTDRPNGSQFDSRHFTATAEGRQGPRDLGVAPAGDGETGLKQQAAAATAGVKESQFSSALNGSGNFAVTWLWTQSDEFLLRFVELLSAARQLTPGAARSARAERVGELVRLLLEDVG